MIVDLEAVLERVLAHLGTGGQKPPALAALKALTELAFWSSLERYEARETRFRYLCHTGAGDEVVMLATLPEEAQVTATLTRKLAAAGSSIVVRESKPGWVTSGLGFASGVQQLWVDALKPGVVRIGYWLFPIAIVEGGKAYFLGDAVNSPVTEIASFLAPEPGVDDPKGARRYDSAAAIRQILNRMRLDHGGTLVVLPTADYAREAFSGSLLLGPTNALAPNAVVQRGHGRELAIAEMANLDGAVVITGALEFVRAGAKISGQGDDFEVETLRPTVPSQAITMRVTELGGTRHQSAARLVFNHHEAIAFVCSSDGPVSVISWSEADHKVKVTQNLEWMLGSESLA